MRDYVTSLLASSRKLPKTYCEISSCFLRYLRNNNITLPTSKVLEQMESALVSLMRREEDALETEQERFSPLSPEEEPMSLQLLEEEEMVVQDGMEVQNTELSPWRVVQKRESYKCRTPNPRIQPMPTKSSMRGGSNGGAIDILHPRR